MLRILGSPKRVCSGITRRDLLEIGGSSLLGLTAASAFRRRSQAADRPSGDSGGSFGRAKNCILLFLYGGASQLDTFDPKPEASTEVRGPFGTIPSVIPGVHVSECLPGVARNLDRVTLIRSMSHPYPIHGVAYAVTGRAQVDIPMELNRNDKRHWPYFGSVLDYLDRREHPATRPAIPRTIHLPWTLSSRSAPHKRAGLLSGFLDPSVNPTVLEFEGEPTGPATYRRGDPFGGLTAESRFRFASTELPAGLTLDRLHSRQSLLHEFDTRLAHLSAGITGRTMDRFRETALAMVGSPALREALDLSKEPQALREQYGFHLFGQSTLMARRMIEAGSRVVSVFWDEFGRSCGAWDTHEKLKKRTRDELCPGFDQTFVALLDDLKQRGLLDETLVLVMTEHGRTPKAERRNNSRDGRGHWSKNYCNLMAGAGVAKGLVLGASNRQGTDVEERPITPKDMLKTIYHLMGVDPELMIPDRLGRPLPLVEEGHVIPEVLA